MMLLLSVGVVWVFWAAFFANAVNDNFLGDYGELILNFLRDLDLVEVNIGEVENFAALYAVGVVMVVGIRVEPSSISVPFSDGNKADLRKRHQGTINRIKRDVGELFPNNIKQLFCRGMGF
jgi:hypothetical protein